MMTIGYNIPLDLITEILLKLPAKSVLRFKYVSKSWCSIINSQHFINTFMSLSLSRPRLLLGFDDSDYDRVLFFSAPYQSSSFLTSSSVLVAEKNALMMPLPKIKSNYDYYICNSVRGFLCCCIEDVFVICNPTTGQVIPLPEKKDYNNYYSMYLGYDPKSDQYKVLRLISPRSSDLLAPIEHSVCTLGGQGSSSHSWRPIKTNILYDYCYQNGVCIDGVVYHEYSNHGKTVLSSFEVGSEQLRLISTPTDLSGAITNYLGKLALFDSLEYEGQFRLWVLDDVENQVWSNKTLVFPPELLCSGITIYGDFVNAPVEFPLSDSCEVPCYDVKKRINRRVRLEGLENIRGFCSSLICFFVDNIIYL